MAALTAIARLSRRGCDFWRAEPRKGPDTAFTHSGPLRGSARLAIFRGEAVIKVLITLRVMTRRRRLPPGSIVDGRGCDR